MPVISPINYQPSPDCVIISLLAKTDIGNASRQPIRTSRSKTATPIPLTAMLVDVARVKYCRVRRETHHRCTSEGRGVHALSSFTQPYGVGNAFQKVCGICTKLIAHRCHDQKFHPSMELFICYQKLT